MDDLQTDTLCDYGKTENENTDLDPKRASDCTVNLHNGCDEIDPLDLMADNCDNESIGSNSDVWKGSDSEDESFENKEDTNTGNVVLMKSSEEADIPNEVGKCKSVNVSESNKENQLSKRNIVNTEENNCNQTKVNERNSEENSSLVQSEIETLTGLSKENDKKTDTVDGKNCQNSDTPLNKKENIETQKNQVVNDEVAKPDKADSFEETEKNQEENSSQNTEKTIETEKDSVDGDVVEVPEKDPLEVVDPMGKDPLQLDSVQIDATNSSQGTNKESTDIRPPNRFTETQDDDVEMDYDADDDGFDPSLFMPEVSMDVDENPVVTTNGGLPHDGERADSPSLCEPLFSTFVDEVTGAEISFNLTSEEQELRKRLYGPTNPIQLTRIHCTACNVHLGSALEGQNNRFVHPLLKVLICKECYHFYTSGEFDKDEDGSELYCRWCGQGGQVLCCSKCEFVFCKRCIRTNFGRKKMFEIRDSDSWDCFRCNSSQIITQRIACYEFFEYVRREMSRASTFNNSSEIWSTDYSRCCTGKKRLAENVEEMKKPKRKKTDADPDYNPLADVSSSTPSIPSSTNAVGPTNTTNSVFMSTDKTMMSGGKTMILPKPVQVMPRYVNKTKDSDIEFVKQIPAPRVTLNTVPRPAYRAILPSTVRAVTQSTPTLLRLSNQPVPPLVPTSNRISNNSLQGRNISSNMMKHEWFEKTVRAAARVNSHLSYTLTQLNKAQSQAASVEELAVVHNKLQEILSSSINSLIQIRKNLRTEFIDGIKTVRLPSKKAENFNNDDDVIFVSAPPVMPMPSTSHIKTTSKDPLIIIDKSNSVVANTSKTTTVSNEKPRLKVKSVMELQHVPSECITIPDDTPVPSDKESESTKTFYKEKESESSIEIDPLGDVPVINIESNFASTSHVKKISNENDGKTVKSDENLNEKNLKENGSMKDSKRKNKNIIVVHNIHEQPNAEIKKMMAVKVNLERVDLEELQKKLSNESKK